MCGTPVLLEGEPEQAPKHKGDRKGEGHATEQAVRGGGLFLMLHIRVYRYSLESQAVSFGFIQTPMMY